jgi:hypothetical protein
MAFNNLPGFEATYKDGGLSLANRGVTTGSVLILGTAVDGPPMLPIPVERLEDAEKLFGPAGVKGVSNNTTLIKSLYEAYNAGCRDIRLMRYTGSTATARLSCAESKVTIDKQYSEILGLSGGNTQFTVNIKGVQDFPVNSEVVPGSVSVTADDMPIAVSAYTVNYEAGTVTVPADVVSGNADVKVFYSRLDHTDTAVVDDPMWNSDGQFKVYRSKAGYSDIKSSPAPTFKIVRTDFDATKINETTFAVPVIGAVSGTPVVKVDGVDAGADDFTFTAGTGEIVFGSAPAASAVITVDYTCVPTAGLYTFDLVAGKLIFNSALTDKDQVLGSYSYDKQAIVSSVDGVALSVSTRPSGADQTFDLFAVPVALDAQKPFKLFAGTAEVSDASYFVNYEEGKVVLKANKVVLGQTISASYFYKEVTDNTPVINFETLSGGSLYNDTTIRISRIRQSGTNVEIGKEIRLIKPLSKKSSAGESDMVFNSIDCPTFGDLVKAINAHALNTVARAEVDDAYAGILTANIHIPDLDGAAQESVDVKFTGGSDGTDKTASEIFKILGGVRDADGNVVQSGVYDLLMNYTVDMVVLTGVYADDVLPDGNNFAEQLAIFCANSTMRNNETLGSISVRPLHPSKNNLAGIQEYVQKLVARGNNYFYRDDLGNYVYDSDGNKLDVGRYISVTVGEPIVAQNAIGKYAAPIAASYAGLISVLSSGNSTTNKLLPNAQGLRFDFSPPQLDALVGARYVVLQNKLGRGVVVVDGVTSAQKGSDYCRLSTLRITTSAVHLIRQVCDPFIGGKNNLVTRNAMGTEIDQALAAMKKAGDLQDYSYTITSSTADAVMGNALIELTLVPAFELRNIKLVVSLRATL